ncbi:MAG: hypothetical protein Q8N53_07730 [Longimicrobiales bacterium]|nr:hypothetical protein [Longimicrobiales bacterium]
MSMDLSFSPAKTPQGICESLRSGRSHLPHPTPGAPEPWERAVRAVLDDMGDRFIEIVDASGGGAWGERARRSALADLRRVFGPLHSVRTRNEALRLLESVNADLVMRLRVDRWIDRVRSSADGEPGRDEERKTA